MGVLEIYFDDLRESAQERLLEFLDIPEEECSFDVAPICVLEREDEEDET